jgi:redox-sensing transcriptional repressor
MESRVLPEPTLRRLPLYLHFLRKLEATGRPAVSSAHLGEELGLDPTQVRKDLEATGVVGRPRVGYDVGELIRAIETALGWNNVRQAFLVGAGNLGQALLGYGRFREAGLDIVAAFDTDSAKIGTEFHGKQVLPVTKLGNLARRMHVMVGILTVPAEAAQASADALVAAGILAIWNFTPVRLRLPEHVIVQNEDIYSGLATLTQKLAVRLEAGIRPTK